MRGRRSIFVAGLLIVSLMAGKISLGENQLVNPPNIEWMQTYGGEAADWGCSVQQTTDGGYIIGGGTDSYGSGGSDAWVLKTDSIGALEWEHVYGGIRNDGVSAIQLTRDEGYIFIGHTESYDPSGRQLWVLKVGLMGNLQWNRTLGRVSELWHAIQPTTDGGYIVTGGARLIKIDEIGQIEWEQTLRHLEINIARAVVQTIDGGYILAGTTSHPDSFGEAWVIKTDEEGQVEWNHAYGVSSRAAGAWVVQQTVNHGYVIVGYTRGFGAGHADFWLLKLAHNGTPEWNQTFGGSEDEIAWTAEITTEGGYILAGSTTSFGSGGMDAWVVKSDRNGTKEWTLPLGESGPDWASAIHQTLDGGYIMVGSKTSSDTGGDIWLVKLSPNPSVYEFGMYFWEPFLLLPISFRSVWKRHKCSRC